MPKSMGCSKSSSRRKAQSDAGLPKEKRKISRKQSNFTPKGTRKRTNEAHSKQKEGKQKIRVDINKIKTKNTIEKFNETNSWFIENIYKIDKALARLIKKIREGIQKNKIRNGLKT